MAKWWVPASFWTYSSIWAMWAGWRQFLDSLAKGPVQVPFLQAGVMAALESQIEHLGFSSCPWPTRIFQEQWCQSPKSEVKGHRIGDHHGPWWTQGILTEGTIQIKPHEKESGHVHRIENSLGILKILKGERDTRKIRARKRDQHKSTGSLQWHQSWLWAGGWGWGWGTGEHWRVEEANGMSRVMLQKCCSDSCALEELKEGEEPGKPLRVEAVFMSIRGDNCDGNWLRIQLFPLKEGTAVGNT